MATFHQYIPDSLILSKTTEEIQTIIDSLKKGPFSKGDPVIDLNLSDIKEIPSNIRFVSNKDIKLSN